MPRRPFNLLTHDAIHLGSSQFKDNFQDPTRDLENCNMVFYFSKKEDLDPITAALTDAQIPFKDTELASDEYKLFVALPEEEHVCESNNILFENFEKLEIYAKGYFPPYWLENGLSSENGVIYVINNCILDTNVFGECVFNTLMFCKNVTLAEEAIVSSEGFNPTLIFNADLYSAGSNSVALQEYNVVLATPSDQSNIAEGTFAGDILNLEYHGEWNTTSRGWFEGMVINLNGIPTPDPFIFPLTKNSLIPGDLLFYDKIEREYCAAHSENIPVVLERLNILRYETNYDTCLNIIKGSARFVANDDAAANMSSLFDDNKAATSCFYRIEIDNTHPGSMTFSATSGDASVSSNTIVWDADEAMSAIVDKFIAKNTTNITFGALSDGTGVGLEIGGYGANTLNVTASESCTIIDCSKLAFYASANPEAPAVGDTFNPTADYTLINKMVHHNWRGASAESLLSGTPIVPPNSDCIANNDINYSLRTGVNFAKFKSWAGINGVDTFYDDGEGGLNESVGRIMRESRFNTEVTNYTGVDSHRLGMKDYYTHLLNDPSGDYASLRQSYEEKYGVEMQSLYDGYIMSHMMKIDANSGIVSTMRGKGNLQTRIKGDVMNVNYNYIIIPAYPPEYNALHYGDANSEAFLPGLYYHPEPADTGLMFRDDLIMKINENISIIGRGTFLTGALYRGTSADYGVNGTWAYSGTTGCLSNPHRSDNGYFLCRPILALNL